MGVFCVATNCTAEHMPPDLQKILTGGCQTGFWLVFDELNRVIPEVLSVFASQIQQIYNALKQSQDTFYFGDDDIKLKSSFGLFTTYNPGYVGRAQLPDNLQSQLCSLTMAVPNVEFILQAKLQSIGVQESAVLSKKMFQLFKNFQNQLSKQTQYDFGLRIILTMVNFLGIQMK